MKINKDEKIGILLALLEERYHASHQMRDRSLKFVMWILGLILIVIPLLIFYRENLTSCIKWSLTALILITGIFTFWFIRAIHIGFNKNKEIIADIEKALGCYEKGAYLKLKQLFPEEYKDAKRFSLCSHFTSIYAWIFAAVLIIVFFIWFNPN